MKHHTTTIMLSMLVLAALILSACQAVPPMTSVSLAATMPAAQPGDDLATKDAVMKVMGQFYEAYRAYDVDKLLSLHTDNAVWTWIDEGKNFPNFGPEGIWIGTGTDEIRAMFDFDRGESGITGYSLWIDVNGNNVRATEVWESAYTHVIDVPLIAQSTYKLSQGKISQWTWSISAETSSRFMTTTDPLAANKELLVTINQEVWDGGNITLIDEYYASDFVRHQYPTEIVGAEAFKQYIQALHAGFPDWHCTLEHMLAEGNMVAERWLCEGTQTGEWMGIPPTGTHVKFTSSIIHRIVDGKVVEDWVDYDSLGFMQQLGFTLAPPP